LKPEINALSTLLIVAVSVGVISASLIAKRAEKIRERANAD
jgi:ABC-type spermidine/putrescine transport system permease subunit II